jgi:hypothetical protein
MSERMASGMSRRSSGLELRGLCPQAVGQEADRLATKANLTLNSHGIFRGHASEAVSSAVVGVAALPDKLSRERTAFAAGHTPTSPTPKDFRHHRAPNTRSAVGTDP